MEHPAVRINHLTGEHVIETTHPSRSSRVTDLRTVRLSARVHRRRTQRRHHLPASFSRQKKKSRSSPTAAALPSRPPSLAELESPSAAPGTLRPRRTRAAPAHRHAPPRCSTTWKPPRSASSPSRSSPTSSAQPHADDRRGQPPPHAPRAHGQHHARDHDCRACAPTSRPSTASARPCSTRSARPPTSVPPRRPAPTSTPR